ncbi:MAG: hypothetical protein HZA35_03705 [Parcubacteria group bacterium]|nr:hypothetical protein [Parcubacteria group bacterium]
MGSSSQEKSRLHSFLITFFFLFVCAVVIVFILKSPSQSATTRNEKRDTDVTTILNAVYRYAIDHDHVFPPAITEVPTEVCATVGSCSNLVDLSLLTKDGTYLLILPKDPLFTTSNSTGYSISKTPNNHIIVSAPHAESNVAISITR